MSKIIIQSSNKKDSPADIEDKLEKALSAITAQRERKEFSDPFLKEEKTKADSIVSAVFQNMIQEIAEVL